MGTIALTREETELVKETIPALRRHGEHISTVFYKTMLRDHPELNNYFNNVNMHTGRQPRALTALILAFASNIANISELVPKLERVAHKHASLNILPPHYEIVCTYLMRAFSAVLGPAMTPDVKVAWTKAYWQMAKMLAGREKIIYQDFGNWAGWRKFVISSKTFETNERDIVSFTIKPVDGKPLPTYKPGQYVTIRVTIPGLKYSQLRQYSLSDAPRPDHYRITVKKDQGTDRDYTSKRTKSSARDDEVPVSSAASSASDSSLGSIQPLRPGLVSNLLVDDFREGDTFDLTHPAGEFYLDPENPDQTPVVLVSAGVCASPLFSILRTISEKQPNREVSWIQGSRLDAPFRSQVEGLAMSRPNVRTKFFRSRLADSDVVSYTASFREDFCALGPKEDLFVGNNLTEYYVCGPEKFMLEISACLQKYGVHPSRVHFELYSVGSFEMKPPKLP